MIRHSTADAAAAYKQLGCTGWISREHYLREVIEWAITHHRDIIKAHHDMSNDLFRRIMTALIAYANRRNGYGVIVRAKTVAPLANTTERSVQYAMAAARTIGLLVDLIPGRMLTWPERCTARNAGSRQRGLSTVGAFVLPPAYVDHFRLVTPPRGQSVLKSVSVSSTSQPRSASALQTAQAPAPTGKNRRRYTKPAGFGLAVALITALHWLTTGSGGLSPGRIATQLTRFATAPHPWTVPQLLHAMTVINRRLGHSSPETAHHPASLLAWYLRQIDPIADHPAHVADLERDEARRRAGAERTARLRTHVEAAAERARTASAESACAAAAQIRQDLARCRA